MCGGDCNPDLFGSLLKEANVPCAHGNPFQSAKSVIVVTHHSLTENLVRLDSTRLDPLLPYAISQTILPQLAVSFLHYDEIDVFDLRTVLPGKDAMPVLSLVPGSTAPTAASGGGSSGRGRSGPFRENSVGMSTATSRSTGRNRGLGHLSLEFVSRRENGRDVTHLIAVGRGGAFRVWKFAPRTARLLAPYLQVRIFVLMVAKFSERQGGGRAGGYPAAFAGSWGVITCGLV